MELWSAAFQTGQPIPARFTCDGDDVSPPLSWTGAPASTKSLALIVDDPDAPSKTWVHWVVWNIPPALIELPEGVSGSATALQSAREGFTDFRKTGYGGPCPPSGVHRYMFKLYALDTTLTPPVKATKQDVLKAMEGHVLAETQLMGTYTRGG